MRFSDLTKTSGTVGFLDLFCVSEGLCT